MSCARKKYCKINDVIYDIYTSYNYTYGILNLQTVFLASFYNLLHVPLKLITSFNIIIKIKLITVMCIVSVYVYDSDYIL